LKKQLILILIISFMVIAVLSGCSAKSQTITGSNQEQQNINSSLLEGSDQSTDESGSKTNVEASKSKPSPISLQRTNQEGQVSLDVIFANSLGEEKEGYLSFFVNLDTHSVDLDSIPLNQFSKLYDGKGNLLADQSEWETEGEGHHLVGKLNFKITQDIQNIDGLKLLVENYGGAAKREFVWDKQYLD